MILKIRCQIHLNICSECTFFSAADTTKFHKSLVKCLSIGKEFQSNYHTSSVHFLLVFPNNKNNTQITAFAKVTFYLNVSSLSASGKAKSDPSGHISLKLSASIFSIVNILIKLEAENFFQLIFFQTIS